MSWFKEIYNLKSILVDQAQITEDEFNELHQIIQEIEVLEVKRRLNDLSYLEDIENEERVFLLISKLELLYRVIDNLYNNISKEILNGSLDSFINPQTIKLCNSIALLIEVTINFLLVILSKYPSLGSIKDIISDYSVIGINLYLIGDNINHSKELLKKVEEYIPKDQQSVKLFNSLRKKYPLNYIKGIKYDDLNEDYKVLFSAIYYQFFNNSAQKLFGSFFEEKVIKVIEKKYPLIWSSQRKVSLLLDAITKNKNFVSIVSLPTSAGKTLYAELAFLRYLMSNPKKKCIYIAPTRALVEEIKGKFKDYENIINEVNIFEEILGNDYIFEGEISAINKSNLIILTPEKFYQIILKGDSELLQSIGLVIFDELQMIGEDPLRGFLAELLFILIKNNSNLNDLSLIALSATCSNDDKIAEWLYETISKDENYETIKIKESWKPTRQICIYSDNSKDVPQFINLGENELYKEQNNHIFRTLNNPEISINLKSDPIERICQIIGTKPTGTLIFEHKKDNILSLCKKISEKLDDSLITNQRKMLARALNNSNIESNDIIQNSLMKGIGMYYAELPSEFKYEVYQSFKKGTLHTLVSSPSLAEGINLPFENAIFHNIYLGPKRIEYSKFINIAGRVGRANTCSDGIILFDDKVNSKDLDLGVYDYTKDEEGILNLGLSYVPITPEKAKRSKRKKMPMINKSLYYYISNPKRLRIKSSIKKATLTYNLSEDIIDVFEAFLIKILSENYRDLDIISEEQLDNLVDQILQSTLILDDRDEVLNLLKSKIASRKAFLISNFSNINSLYSKTGFCAKGNEIFFSVIDNIISKLFNEIFNNIYDINDWNLLLSDLINEEDFNTLMTIPEIKRFNKNIITYEQINSVLQKIIDNPYEARIVPQGFKELFTYIIPWLFSNIEYFFFESVTSNNKQKKFLFSKSIEVFLNKGKTLLATGLGQQIYDKFNLVYPDISDFIGNQIQDHEIIESLTDEELVNDYIYPTFIGNFPDFRIIPYIIRLRERLIPAIRSTDKERTVFINDINGDLFWDLIPETQYPIIKKDSEWDDYNYFIKLSDKVIKIPFTEAWKSEGMQNAIYIKEENNKHIFTLTS